MEQIERDAAWREVARHQVLDSSFQPGARSGAAVDPERLLVRVVVAGRSVLARVESALTAANAGELTERLRGFCVYGSRCVLDLRRCQQLDGAGVSALLEIQEELARGGGELRLVAERDQGIGRTLWALDRTQGLVMQSELSLA